MTQLGVSATITPRPAGAFLFTTNKHDRALLGRHRNVTGHSDRLKIGIICTKVVTAVTDLSGSALAVTSANFNTHIANNGVGWIVRIKSRSKVLDPITCIVITHVVANFDGSTGKNSNITRHILLGSARV